MLSDPDSGSHGSGHHRGEYVGAQDSARPIHDGGFASRPSFVSGPAWNVDYKDFQSCFRCECGNGVRHHKISAKVTSIGGGPSTDFHAVCAAILPAYGLHVYHPTGDATTGPYELATSSAKQKRGFGSGMFDACLSSDSCIRVHNRNILQGPAHNPRVESILRGALNSYPVQYLCRSQAYRGLLTTTISNLKAD